MTLLALLALFACAEPPVVAPPAEDADLST